MPSPLEAHKAVTRHTFHLNLLFANRRLKPRTRADAARARVVDSVGVAAPGAFLQLRQEGGQPLNQVARFSALDSTRHVQCSCRLPASIGQNRSGIRCAVRRHSMSEENLKHASLGAHRPDLTASYPRRTQMTLQATHSRWWWSRLNQPRRTWEVAHQREGLVGAAGAAGGRRARCAPIALTGLAYRRPRQPILRMVLLAAVQTGRLVWLPHRRRIMLRPSWYRSLQAPTRLRRSTCQTIPLLRPVLRLSRRRSRQSASAASATSTPKSLSLQPFVINLIAVSTVAITRGRRT